MINRFYFMKTTTELTTGERVYNNVIRTHCSFFRNDHTAYNVMVDEVSAMWKDHIESVHVTDFKKL